MMVVELGLQLFVVFMVLNVTILLFAFRRWSMNTICFGSPKLWGHWLLAVSMVFALMWLIHHHWYVFFVVFVLFVLFFVLFILITSSLLRFSLLFFSYFYSQYRHQFSMYRRRYLERLRQGGKYNLPESRKLNEIEEPDDATETISELAIHGRAIVVTGLPDWMYASRDPDAALHHFFDVLFPRQIDSVVLARQPSSELVSCMEERKDIYTRMESALADKRKCLAGGEKEAKYVRPLFSVEEVKRKSERCCNCCRSSCCDSASGGLNDDVNDDVDDDVTMTVGVQRELDEVEERLSKLLLETGCGSTLGHEIYEEMTGYVVFRSVAGRSLAVQSLLTTPWESSNISGF